MGDNTVKQVRKKIIIILFLSIICLILISFLPWIAVAENDYVKEDLNFNYEMMKDSSNTKINDLVIILMDINILFWTIIIITLISFILTVCYTLFERTLFAKMVIISSSFIIFAICIIIIYYQIVFSRSINEIEFISGSMIYPPFAYAYIQFILSVILLVVSGSYSLALIRYSSKNLKNLQIKKKEKKKEIKQTRNMDIPVETEIEKSIKISGDKKTLSNSSREEKLAEIDKLLSKKEPEIKKEEVDKEISKKDLDKQQQIKTPSENEIVTEDIEIKGESYKETEPEIKEIVQIKHTFPEKKPKIEQQESDEIKLSEHFEKALYNAIEKKQSKTKPKQKSEKEANQEEKLEPTQIETKKEKVEPDFENDKNRHEEKDKTSKILNVKCPECNHIFQFNKKNDDNKIVCPNCGKEGKIEIKI
jgi:ribosomal protein S27E